MPNKIARYGWLPQLPDQRDKLWRPQFMKTYGVVALPATTDLRPQCPPVYDQGQLGSCTANAIAAAFDFERHRQSEPFMTPSRLFIYYNERAIEGTIASDAGANLRDGFKVINSHGVCYESQWPYDISQFTERPWPKCYATANTIKCLQYLALNPQSVAYFPHNPDSPLPSMETNYALQLRQCLADGYPFVYGFTVYDSFESDSVAASGIVNLPAPAESVVGGHAVLCVGYDDTTQRFLCRNSWGSSWGMAGYFTIPYAYLSNPNLASDFWTIRLVSK